MRDDTELPEAGRLYRAAYAAQYTGRDLPGALQLYMPVVASHPNTQEAGYSRSQTAQVAVTPLPSAPSP
jgi:hypothetical protein